MHGVYHLLCVTLYLRMMFIATLQSDHSISLGSTAVSILHNEQCAKWIP